MINHGKALLVLAILSLGFLSGCSTRGGPPASVHYDKVVSPYHVVKKGDSIASIARKYNMDKRELIRLNGLDSPYRIVKGQKLLVRAKVADAEDADESEMPATEGVPEEGGISVKTLPPVGEDEKVRAQGRETFGAENEGLEPGEREYAGTGEQGDGRLGRGDGELDRQGEEPASGKTGGSVNKPAYIPEPPPAASTYIPPVKGKVIRGYNPSGNGKGKNFGVNIAAPKGTPVVAANNGVVAHSGNQVRGFGNVVLVKQSDGIMTVYAHLDKVAVKNGDKLYAGQKLGTVGQTGTVTEPQLHFEIREGSKPVDPAVYLPGEISKVSRPVSRNSYMP